MPIPYMYADDISSGCKSKTSFDFELKINNHLYSVASFFQAKRIRSHISKLSVYDKTFNFRANAHHLVCATKQNRPSSFIRQVLPLNSK